MVEGVRRVICKRGLPWTQNRIKAILLNIPNFEWTSTNVWSCIFLELLFANSFTIEKRTTPLAASLDYVVVFCSHSPRLLSVKRSHIKAQRHQTKKTHSGTTGWRLEFDRSKSSDVGKLIVVNTT